MHSINACYVASDLVLHCLPMSDLWDAEHKRVNIYIFFFFFFFFSVMFHCTRESICQLNNYFVLFTTFWTLGEYFSSVDQIYKGCPWKHRTHQRKKIRVSVSLRLFICKSVVGKVAYAPWVNIFPVDPHTPAPARPPPPPPPPPPTHTHTPQAPT